jgi:acyl-CoA dehydrogenase
MDLTFSAEERAFEQEVRDYIASSLTPEMKRATALTPSVFSDPDIGMAWQRALHKKGWGAPGAGSSRPNAPAPACRMST